MEDQLLGQLHVRGLDVVEQALAAFDKLLTLIESRPEARSVQGGIRVSTARHAAEHARRVLDECIHGVPLGTGDDAGRHKRMSLDAGGDLTAEPDRSRCIGHPAVRIGGHEGSLHPWWALARGSQFVQQLAIR